MKRAAPGTYRSYDQAAKRQRARDFKPYPKAKPQRQNATVVAGEMKYFDTERTAVTIGTVTTTWIAGTIADPSSTINLGAAAVATPLSLFSPTVGAALNQRIGRKVKVMKIKIHGHMNCPAQSTGATADDACKVRVLLVQDHQTNGAQMTGAQLLNDAGAASTTINSFQNPNNFGRFRVLKDKMFQMGNPSMAGAAATIEQAGMIYNFKFTVNFKEPVIVNFNATNGGTVADIVDNSFHVIAGGDNIELAPNINYYARICYKE